MKTTTSTVGLVSIVVVTVVCLAVWLTMVEVVAPWMNRHRLDKERDRAEKEAIWRDAVQRKSTAPFGLDLPRVPGQRREAPDRAAHEPSAERPAVSRR